MERTLATVDDCVREVRLSLSTQELKPHYEKAYARAQQDVTLPGFRKGKVPIPMIKQRFGRELENEALETIADEEFRNFVRAEKLKVVGQPSLTDIAKSQDGVAFTIRFDVMPAFELGSYRGLTVNRPLRTVQDEDVQSEIDRICMRASTFEPAEQVTDNRFIVTISMHELDKETSMPIIGAEAREERVFLEDDNVDMHLRSSLMNTKVGDSFSYVAETKNENEQPNNYRVTVTDVMQVIPAEFTNEFAETITGGQFKTTEELRSDIERQLSEYFTNASRESVENQIVDQLVSAHSFMVPEPLVHAVVHQLVEDFKKRNAGAPGIDKLDAHAVEHEFRPSAERIARWELIRDAIIEAEELSISDEDVAAAAVSYGVTEEQLRMVMRQNNALEDRMLAEKVMRVLVDYAIISDVTVDADFQSA